MKTGALILAAGKGTRMVSPLPKALQPLLGVPMLAHVAAALKPLFADELHAVIGHGAESIEAAFAGGQYPSIRFVHQTEQLGTGHALKISLPVLEHLERLVVINGDMPLISTAMMQHILDASADADMSLATITLSDAGAYGRVVRDPHTGNCLAVVEAKDYDASRYGPATGEINIGLYVLNLAVVAPLLSQLTNSNKSGEYYITDLIHLANSAQLRVTAIACGSDPALLGVNNPEELVRSESLLRENIVLAHLRNGVTLHQPEQLVVGPFVTIESGAVLAGPSHILGHTHICCGANIGPFCHITDTRIESGAVVQPYSHFLSAHVGPACTVGPFSRLRPGAVLDEAAHVGNFVELKQTRLGRGAKANHLTYLGDTEVGPAANIGAGTITCNYDGIHKHRTVIGEKAFIGSNASLVAPVSIGAGSIVGAGSVITADVPDNGLAIARGRQYTTVKRS